MASSTENAIFRLEDSAQMVQENFKGNFLFVCFFLADERAQ